MPAPLDPRTRLAPLLSDSAPPPRFNPVGGFIDMLPDRKSVV